MHRITNSELHDIIRKFDSSPLNDSFEQSYLEITKELLVARKVLDDIDLDSVLSYSTHTAACRIIENLVAYDKVVKK